jgi:poly(3-hydroxybutyrate) depolymerase
MEKKLTFFAFLFFCSIQIFGQSRYLDSLFTPIVSQQNVVYGQAQALNFPYFLESWTYTQNLALDVYEPQGDTMTAARPCIVYAHGGAFLLGSRTDAPVVKFCNAMAAKGYVVASVSYRLGFNLTDSAAAERAVYRGVQDVKAAIRYVKEQAANWNIDTSRVFAAGNSAGSVAVIHAAYVREAERNAIPATFNTPNLGCISCSGNALTHGDVPLAIANLWGAIADTAFIGANDNVSMISFHGTNDDSVFPGHERPFSFPNFPKMMGSTLITSRLENLGIETEYWSFAGQGHEPWGAFGTTPYFDTIVEKTAEFFYPYLIPPLSTQAAIAPTMDWKIYPNPVSDVLNIELANIFTKNYRIYIVNSLGQMVHTQTTNGDKSQIYIPHLPNGWYGLILEGEDFRITKSFLKI